MTDRNHCTGEEDERALVSDSGRPPNPSLERRVPADWLIESGVGSHQDREVGEN